jgi:LPXTG-motif cell wall-anchored protein
MLRRAAVLLAAIALCSCAAAQAQAPAVPPSSAGVSTKPPVQLGGGHTGSTSSAAGNGALPNTGSDPRLLFGVGLALTLLGVGLRLRTADAELY